MRMLVTISWGASLSLPAFSMASFTITSRSPSTLTTTRRAFSATKGERVSAAGEALQMLPPTVPLLRIWVEPTVEEAMERKGTCLRRTSDSLTSVWLVMAPMRMESSRTSMPRSSGSACTSIRYSTSFRREEPSRSCTIRSVPPA